MSAHIAPHRWADALAGTVDDGELADMHAHAARCTTCGRAKARVERVSQSFPELRAQGAPELGWDGVRAGIHWTLSKERRDQERTGSHARLSPRRRWLPLLAFAGTGALVAGAAALLLTSRSSTKPVAGPAPVAVAPAPRVTAPTPLGALVVRAVGDGTTVDGAVRSDLFERVLTQGTVLATGASSLDLQFDSNSALALAPGTKLELTHFDSDLVELRLDQGSVDIVVSKRTEHQRFVVVAGGRAVEVRGTQFRVTHGPAKTSVACAHGKVVVRDGSGEVEVPGDRAVEVEAAAPITSTVATALGADARDDLIATTPRTLPMWTSPAELLATSSPLEVSTPNERAVRIDGIEVGHGAVRMRVMPGRHTVETADAAGRFRRAGWVDVTAGAVARLDAQPEAPTVTGGVAARRQQLLAGLDRARLATCTRAIAKAGVTDTFVRFEISIDDTGAVQFLNIIDTDLPSATARCVRDTLADIRFARGPSATFREKLDL